MQNTKDEKDYRYYSFEDFLEDDFFISSIKNPTRETFAFWETFKMQNGENLYNFNSAKSYLESYPVSEDALSDKEIAEMWNNINTRNASNSQRRVRRLYLAVAGAAAGIAAMLIGIYFYQTSYTESDIYRYANQTQSGELNSSEAQLILSEDKVVVIEDKESEITYQSASVKIKDESISKKDIAEYNELKVPRGKRSMLTFSEGTKVWVNAGTRVVYPAEFNSEEREIYVDGEIYIEVAPNKNWPFVVKTKDVGVQVLGTIFNVTAYDSDPVKRIVLVSGSVKVGTRKKGEEVLLSPNKMYEYNDGQNKITNVDVDKYISWKDGMYLFENEKLENILSRLSMYYGEDIRCDDISANLRCSGKLDLKGDLLDVLHGLSYTAPVTFKDNDGIYMIKYKP
ncbi:MAG: FecR family protein [Dysgonomonas sp.]